MPQAAVIMTVYNEPPAALARAVESILAQTFKDFLVNLVDDGSTDMETRNCLESLREKDSRINLIRQNNTGPMGAANRGIAAADAPLIVRHDSDDWSTPDRLEKQIAFMADHPQIVALGGATRLYQENGRAIADRAYPRTPDKVRSAFHRINPFAHGATCFRRDTAEAIGLYDAKFRSLGDYDFFWRLIDHATATGGPESGGANLPDVVYHYVFRIGSISETRVRERRLNKAIIELRARARTEGRHLSYDDAAAQVPPHALDPALTLVSHGDDLMRAGRFGAAVPAYMKGWLKAPARLKALAKLGRLGAYAALPGQRWRMFKEPLRKLSPPGE